MAAAKKKSPSFEEALEELEAMIETMDSGQIPLEKLIANYERGATLITHCEEVLLNAKKRLELITLTPSPTTKDEDTTQSNNHDEAAASDDSNDDEIRLF